MAKKTRQHKIDEAAKRVLKEVLDDVSWNVEMSPDYGIDFRVQMLDGENVSWQVFLVQLKGHERFSRIEKKGCAYVKHSLWTARLADYFEIYQEPVFIGLVDTSSKQARYLFAQAYADSEFLPPGWRKQKHATLYVPDENDFRDQDRFREDLDYALKYMNDMYPGSIEAAIRHAETQYRKIDPRLDVKCDFKDGKPNFRLMAKKDVSIGIKISASGDDAQSRIDRLLDAGLPTEFTSDEIVFSGSPLFDRKMPAGPLTVQFGKTRDIFFSLIRLDGHGREAARLDGLRGQLTAGKERYHFHAEMESGPLVVHADDLAYTGRSASLAMKLAVKRWDGLPICQLPGFDQLLRVLGDCGALEYRFSIMMRDDGSVLNFTLKDFPQEALIRFSTVLGITRKLREIATSAGINPRFRADLNRDQIENARRVHTIVTTGERITPLAKARFTIKLPRKGVEQILGNESPEDVTITSGEQLDFYADPVPFGTCTRLLTRMRIANTTAIRAQLKKKNTKCVTVILEGQDGAQMHERIDL